MTTNNKGFKLLEEKIDGMISLIAALRKERDELQQQIKEQELAEQKLRGELNMYKDADSGALPLPDVKELLDTVKEERTMVRDSIRGALRLINE